MHSFIEIAQIVLFFSNYMISFTRKPNLVGSSTTSWHSLLYSLRCASLRGVVSIFFTMKSKAVTPDCSLWVIRTVMGR